MPDVRMPDGTVIRNVPEGTPREDLLRVMEMAAQQQGAGQQQAGQLGQNQQSLPTASAQPPASGQAPTGGGQPVPSQQQMRPATVQDNQAGSTFSTIADRGSRTFINNLLAAPSAMGDVLAAGAGGLQTLIETPFTEGGFLERAKGNIEQQQDKFPASALRAIPRPTFEGISAGVQAAPALAPGGETFADEFTRQRAEIEQQQQQQSQQSPIASRTGEVVGDIATLAAGRQPFARRLSRSPATSSRVQSKTARDALETLAKEQPDLVPEVAKLIGSGRLATPGATRLWRRIAESDAVQSVARGAGKSLETGLEGAVLSAIKDNDPFMNAGLAAGGQALASATGTMLAIRPSLKGIVGMAAGYFTFFRLAQEFGTGENNMFSAADTAFDKMALGATLGLASQVAGGRFRGSSTLGKRFAEDLPKFSDALNSIPRGAILSITNQVQQEQEEGANITLPTLEALQTNPGIFSESIRNRLDRAMRTGNLASEIDKLSDNEAFLQTLENLRTGE